METDGGHTLLANGLPYFKLTIGTISITGNLDIGSLRQASSGLICWCTESVLSPPAAA